MLWFNKIRLGGWVVGSFIVTDQGLVRTSIVDRITNILKVAEIEYQVFSEITPDPTIEVLQSGVEGFLKDNYDLPADVLAISIRLSLREGQKGQSLLLRS